ncbi:MAG: CBS domain-containing protein, partial [Candidatus Hydrogenedentales bacterium]
NVAVADKTETGFTGCEPLAAVHFPVASLATISVETLAHLAYRYRLRKSPFAKLYWFKPHFTMVTHTASTQPERFIAPNLVMLDRDVPDTSALVQLMATRIAEVAGIAPEDVLYSVRDDLAEGKARDFAAVHGIARFRVFSDKVKRIMACVAVLRRPIPNDLGGGGTIEAAFLFLGPAAQRNAMIKLRAAVDLLADSKDDRKQLFRGQEPDELSAFLDEWFVGHESDLYARDVMRPPFLFLTTETSLRQVVHQMLRFGVEAIGIVDGQRHLVGEITSDMLFQMGMPDFFSQLKSVAFLGEFDPFEKYFEKEAGLTAGSVMSTNFAAVAESTPIIEIIFQLAVRRHWKVYVVRDGELVGVIDRLRVLETVLNS